MAKRNGITDRNCFRDILYLESGSDKTISGRLLNNLAEADKLPAPRQIINIGNDEQTCSVTELKNRDVRAL